MDFFPKTQTFDSNDSDDYNFGSIIDLQYN